MGKRGPAPKAPGRRQGHRPSNLVPIQGGKLDRPIPDPPEELSPGWADRWVTYWESDVAQAAVEVDLPAITRLFLMCDEWERCWKGYLQQRVVEGSTGQPVLNPLAKQAKELDVEIRALEADFGLTPLARSRLGIAIGQAKLTAAEINRMVNDNADDKDSHKELTVEGWQEAE